MRDGRLLAFQITAGLMFAHQIAGKAARDGLFLLQHGPAGLPAMIAGAAAFSVLLSVLNGRMLRGMSPRTILAPALGASGALQLAECWLLRIDPAVASILIYLHMAGVGAVLLSTFWSMLNEEFDPREAKRQFGRIAAGGTGGGLIGGLVAERAVAWSGATALMLVLAGLHFACAAFLALRLRGNAPAPAAVSARAPVAKPHQSTLLRALAALVLLGAIGAALLDYAFKVNVTEAWGRGNDLLRFFAFFHSGVALLSFVAQTGATRVLLEKFGLGKSIGALPVTLAGGSFLALVAPGAAMAGIARAAEAVVHGSIFRAGYETCYTPVPPAEKRLAKTFIDVAAERGGDAIGAGLVWLCIHFADTAALPLILGGAAFLGVCSMVLCGTLDRIYIQALARSLQSRAVELNLDSNLDLTTRSVVLRAPIARPRPASAPDVGHDAVLRRLTALRSDDPAAVHAALAGRNLSDPPVIAQICLLLGSPEHALMAQGVLYASASKALGLLTDLMLDASLDVDMRRRIPRLIGSVPGQRAADALIAGLEDTRFDVRMQCARALVKTAAALPSPVLPHERIVAAVDRELSIGTVLWESHRKQLRDPAEPGSEWLDELLRDKAHGSLEYVFTLLSLVHDRGPLMAAFRSLHLEDRRLRGTALEYLEGILPAKTRGMLWEILQERPSRSAGRSNDEILSELLNASETVVLRLRRDRG